MVTRVSFSHENVIAQVESNKVLLKENDSVLKYNLEIIDKKAFDQNEDVQNLAFQTRDLLQTSINNFEQPGLLTNRQIKLLEIHDYHINPKVKQKVKGIWEAFKSAFCSNKGTPRALQKVALGVQSGAISGGFYSLYYSDQIVNKTIFQWNVVNNTNYNNMEIFKNDCNTTCIENLGSANSVFHSKELIPAIASVLSINMFVGSVFGGIVGGVWAIWNEISDSKEV